MRLAICYQANTPAGASLPDFILRTSHFVPRTSSNSNSTYGLPVRFGYPKVTETWEAKGYKGFSSIQWYPLEKSENWSLDDKENLGRVRTEVLPGAEEWSDADTVQKGREITVKALVFDAPDVEKTGKFRTQYKTSSRCKSDYNNLNNKVFTRERAVAKREITKL